MKFILVLALLSVVVVGLIGYAEAYDGKIGVSTDKTQYVQGDLVTISGHIIRADPIPDEKVSINFVERSTEKTIHTIMVKIDEESKFEDDDDEYWAFEYVYDTGNGILDSDTIYDVWVIYDDAISKFDFDFRPLVTEQTIQGDELLAKMDKTEIVCPANYDPVCGVDGKTYPNSCGLAQKNIEIAYHDECVSALEIGTHNGTFGDTGRIQWINLNEELVLIYPTSIDRMFERGYLIDHELYLHQKNNLDIRIFDPTFRSYPMTEAESRLLKDFN